MYREVLNITLRHGYYYPAASPLSLVPDDPREFAILDRVLRPLGKAWHVLLEKDDLPKRLNLRVVAQKPEVFSVTMGSLWSRTPIISAPLGVETPTLDPVAPATKERDLHGGLLLAHLEVDLEPALNADARHVEVRFEPVASFWAYHIVGPGAELTEVFDPEGAVDFVAMPPSTLPDGRPVTMWCSKNALTARAMTPHRFALKTPGPFGPRTLVPVLPAPGADFVSRLDPGSSEPRVQSNIYVSLV